METLVDPATTNNFHQSGKLLTGIVELAKKRKLQYEFGNSGVPCPKYRFRDRPRIVQEYLNPDISEIGGNPFNNLTGTGICDGIEPPEEMDDDIDSITRVYDNNMIFPGDGRASSASGTSDKGQLSSTSSNSSSSNVFSDTLYSLGSRRIKQGDNTEAAWLEGTQQTQLMHRDLDYPCFGANGDYIVSEAWKDGIEFSDAAIQDIMLYSNDVAPHELLLSSESRSAGQDALSGPKKPTIDQEFEQYFSMLML